VFAKLGSDMKKPDAVTVITPEHFREQIWHLPASDLLGVGRATAKKLHALGVHTIGDLARYPSDCLRYKFGKCGEEIWKYANGLDSSKVVTRSIEDVDKTAGHGITTTQDLLNAGEVWPVMLELSQNVGHRLHLYEKKATGVAIDIRDNTLFSQQWQCRLPYPTQSAARIAEACFDLFQGSYRWRHPVRAVSVRAISLIAADQPYQYDLFHDASAIEREEIIDRAIEELRARFGNRIIRHAVLMNRSKMPGADVMHRQVIMKGI
jgi:DNA polymerase-4